MEPLPIITGESDLLKQILYEMDTIVTKPKRQNEDNKRGMYKSIENNINSAIRIYLHKEAGIKIGTSCTVVKLS